MLKVTINDKNTKAIKEQQKNPEICFFLFKNTEYKVGLSNEMNENTNIKESIILDTINLASIDIF